MIFIPVKLGDIPSAFLCLKRIFFLFSTSIMPQPQSVTGKDTNAPIFNYLVLSTGNLKKVKTPLSEKKPSSRLINQNWSQTLGGDTVHMGLVCGAGLKGHCH